MNSPPVPAELDLRDFQYMPLDVIRLVDSDLTAIASGEEFKAAVILWCKAWHQVPASSLPDDDRMLAHLAGFGRDVKEWRKVREVALRGFERCSDGRLYHPVIAEKAIDAAEAKRKQRERTSAATTARKSRKTERDDNRNERRDDAGDGERNEQRDDERSDDRNVDQGKRREGKGNSIALTSDTARAQGEPSHSQTCIDLLDTRITDLDQWEIDFLISVKWAERLTKPQADKLSAIQDRLAAKGLPAKQLPSVKRGTPAFAAWIAHYRALGKKTAWYEAQEAFTVPSEYPPGSEAA